MERLSVGVLAPEDATLPAPPGCGSLTGTIAELAVRLAGDCDVVVGARGERRSETVADGIRYVFEPARGDARRGAVVGLANKVERKLGLPDLPYVGRASYFRGYARAHAATFAAAGTEAVLLYNVVQWLPRLRDALPRARLVLYMHAEWLAELPRRPTLERLLFADAVLGVSCQIADQVRERYPEIAARVAVVPNAVDTDVFRPLHGPAVDALRRRLALDDGPVLLFAGRLSAEKGLHTLIEAMPRILERAPRATLVLAGVPVGLRSPLPTRARRELAGHPEWRARYIDHLRSLAAPLGAHVRFVGTLERAVLPAAYALADVYIQPSVFESYGLPVAEAMACGVPVVAAASGALPELVVHDHTGLVVPPGDAAALADAVCRILAEPATAARFGAAGRGDAARFSWDDAARQLRDVLTACRTTRTPPGRRAAVPVRTEVGLS